MAFIFPILRSLLLFSKHNVCLINRYPPLYKFTITIALLCCLTAFDFEPSNESKKNEMQYFISAVSIIELHKLRNDTYPDSLKDLEFLSDSDDVWLSFVRYKKKLDGYNLYIKRSDSGSHSIEIPVKFKKGLGIKNTNIKWQDDFANKQNDIRSIISIEPYSGIFKNRSVLFRNIEVIETKAAPALATVLARLDIKNSIGPINISFIDKVKGFQATTSFIEVNSEKRPIIEFSTRGLIYDGYDIEKKLIHELTHAVLRDVLKEQYHKLPKWFKEGVSIWVADQVREKEKYFISRSAFSNFSPFF